MSLNAALVGASICLKEGGLMKWLAILAFFPAWSFGYTYSGEFSEIHSTGGACDKVFEEVKYTAKFHFFGSNGTTSVVHLESESGKGFLHRATQVGLYGGLGDFKADRKYESADGRVSLVAEGIIDPKFLMFTQNVVIQDAKGETVCQARASFSSF